MGGLPFQSRSVRPFLVAGLLLPIWVAVGTIGYRWIEGWSWFDSLYMTVITLSTVGYREVHDLSTAGQVFTMVICVGGIFTLFTPRRQFWATSSAARSWIISGVDAWNVLWRK